MTFEFHISVTQEEESRCPTVFGIGRTWIQRRSPKLRIKVFTGVSKDRSARIGSEQRRANIIVITIESYSRKAVESIRGSLNNSPNVNCAEVSRS